jgi:hypothetical protein
LSGVLFLVPKPGFHGAVARQCSRSAPPLSERVPRDAQWLPPPAARSVQSTRARFFGQGRRGRDCVASHRAVLADQKVPSAIIEADERGEADRKRIAAAPADADLSQLVRLPANHRVVEEGILEAKAPGLGCAG